MDAFKPTGWPTVVPRIIVNEVADVVGFLRIVFGATGVLRVTSPSEMKIGDSIVMVSDGGGIRDAMRAFLYVYVENVDETYERAVEARAQTVESPADMPWGDRRATVRDPWGNVSQVATHRAR